MAAVLVLASGWAALQDARHASMSTGGARIQAARLDCASSKERHGFCLRERSIDLGLDFVHAKAAYDPKVKGIEPHIAGVGASVAACDANGDGLDDLYLTSSAIGSRNKLYIQQPDGAFRDEAEQRGLAFLSDARGPCMGSWWADADGDGDQDALVMRHGAPSLHRNDDGRFVDLGVEAGLPARVNGNGACWFDADGDGLLDLYLAGYFRAEHDLQRLDTTRIMQDSFEFANNGGRNHLLRNLGGMRFEDVTAQAGVDSTRWTLAVAAADMDGDGRQDLYLANDYGPEELFLNRGGLRFERKKGVGLDESSKSGMCVALGDFLNDGTQGVYVTNISKQGYLFQGNNLRANRLASGGRMQNIAEGIVCDCGWAWGVQFADLDNDFDLDLVVLNGFISASKERDYWFGMAKIGVATGGIAEDASFWPPIDDRSLSGYEVSRLLLNQGRARFVDIAPEVGLVDDLDGRGVALFDHGGDGDLDLAIANNGQRALFYENESASGRGWIQFALRGAAPNTSAVGARVAVKAAGRVLAQTIAAGSGFAAQNSFVLHFGLGAATPEEVEIRWPSGRVQRIDRPASGRRHIVVEGG
jgi:hypothetical protein